MKQKILEFSETIKDDLVRFTQEIVSIQSYTCEENQVIEHIKNKMISLGYDDVIQDGLGNLIGVIGNGPVKVLFDSHVDTVEVNDHDEWKVGPFSGEIVDGRLYGRGSVDMKSAVAATVYAGHAIKSLGLHEGKTIYVSTSVMEEDYDGEPLTYLCERNKLTPDYAVICEPSSLKLALGHKGRALIQVDIEGVSAHGSAPEEGVNAIYKMNSIIGRIEAKGKAFMDSDEVCGSLALTKIESEAVSINAIPPKCSIYLDRRLEIGEDYDYITGEMKDLLDGTDATWKIYDEIGTSFTGQELILHSFLPAWEIDKEHHLTQSCLKAFRSLNGNDPVMFKWDFCTNGVATAKLGIPTIGFGPGDAKLAHMRDENCPVDEIVRAFEFYTSLVGQL